MYTPTLTSYGNNEAFYENIDSLFKSTPASDKLILMVLGNFKARVGSDYES